MNGLLALLNFTKYALAKCVPRRPQQIQVEMTMTVILLNILAPAVFLLAELYAQQQQHLFSG